MEGNQNSIHVTVLANLTATVINTLLLFLKEGDTHSSATVSDHGVVLVSALMQPAGVVSNAHSISVWEKSQCLLKVVVTFYGDLYLIDCQKGMAWTYRSMDLSACLAEIRKVLNLKPT